MLRQHREFQTHAMLGKVGMDILLSRHGDCKVMNLLE